MRFVFTLCLSSSLLCIPCAGQIAANAPGLNVALSASVEASTYHTGSKSVVIPSPTADLSEIGPNFRVVLEGAVPNSNRLVAAFLPADDLANVRAGISKGAPRYALIETLRRGEFTEVDADSFKKIAAAVAQQYGTSLEGLPVNWKAQEEELNHKLKAVGMTKDAILDKPMQLGAFFSNPDACGFGVITPVSAGGSSIKMVTGMTVLRVRNRLLYSAVFAVYKDEASVQWVRNTSEQWAESILQANE